MSMKVDRKSVDHLFDALPDIPNRVWREAGRVFKSSTPVKTGNARRRTTTTAREIRADYAYASVLDAGRGFRDGQLRGSEQAPNGMTEPTLQFIEEELQRRWKILNRRS